MTLYILTSLQSKFALMTLSRNSNTLGFLRTRYTDNGKLIALTVHLAPSKDKFRLQKSYFSIMKTVKSISYQHLQLAPSYLLESDNWENEK